MKEKVIQGEALEEMKQMPSNSIDTIITDPPYGLSFMGKKWDYDVPSVELWREALRVLKSGGTALIFAGSRTQHRMAVNVEDAGFILKDTIMWIYGSGFPKATDISKQLDKLNGREPKQYKELGKYLKQKRGTRPQKDISKLFPSKTGGLTGCLSNWELGANVPTKTQWVVLKKKLGLDDRFDELIDRVEAEREVVGKKKMLAVPVSDQLDGWGQSNEIDITISKTPEAILWNGWKSHGLKPAYEPILVAMKPNDGTYANNALKHRVSGLNIDGGRIGMSEDDKEILEAKSSKNPTSNYKNNKSKKYGDYKKDIATPPHQQGRFPANIILDSDKYGEWTRFFYIAKASKRERGEGNNHPTVKPLALMEYLCTLTKTPTGGIVLDPFAGSGTTGIACKNTGRDFILIEREKEYIDIIEARLKVVPKQLF